ncbi:tetratricopeptide repeat protein [Streptantibioticus silvisoli]|uniref:Tetratricopeptide repeat protein n=1 Tax=Streptantibioticus silvisoli TaxID=2705255 RepID=A0ABT6W814_9ACTN|nr:tetratricopeptide repeat protein [Streptantibioticus silvisoli]MDI5966890.1 tetratricopeptide repeat protein [Streptantibioticus silvisoli]
MLRRAVDAAVPGGAHDEVLAAGRTEFDREIAPAAAGTYAAYLAAVSAAPPGTGGAATPVLVAGVGGVTAFAADLAHGLGAGACLGTGVAVAAVAGVAGGVRNALRGRRAASSGVRRAREEWLAELDRRGVRPWLARATAAPARPAASPPAGSGAVGSGAADSGAADSGAAGSGAVVPAQVTAAVPAARVAAGARTPAVPERAGNSPAPGRRSDRSAAARQRALLERSFGQLPEPVGPFAGRATHLAAIGQWVRHSRASTPTRPTVVMLHGATGSGRSALAVRAAGQLRDRFRGVCVVTLRGGAAGETALTTREALLHLMHRFGAPREQLLFREAPSGESHTRRLAEQYQKHLAGVPVIVVLDDAADPEQVRALVPLGSGSLVLVTSAAPVPLDGINAEVYELPVEALDAAGAEELLSELAGAGAVRDPEAAERIRRSCGGLPLALRTAGSSLGSAPGSRTPAQLADALAGRGEPDPVGRALALRYADLPEGSRRLLRLLALAGRASLGAGAAASLLASPQGGAPQGTPRTAESQQTEKTPESQQTRETPESQARRLLGELAAAGLVEHVRGSRYRLHDAVRGFAQERLLAEEDPAGRTAARERLIRTYSALADSVIRLVDGRTSTRADAVIRGAVGAHGFRSLDQALSWLDEESSFITATVRTAEGVDPEAVRHLLGALCDYCLLRGDLYRLGEVNELAQAVDHGLLTRSVRWHTGVAARHLGELDRAHSTLASVVDRYFEAADPVGAARALGSLGVTLHHQGRLGEAAARLREALELQAGGELGGDRAWTLHALGAVLRDQGHVTEAVETLREALELHAENESVHGMAWAHLQLGQAYLRLGRVERAAGELRHALGEYAATRDNRGTAWTMTQLARAGLQRGDAAAAVAGLTGALVRHRENEDARGEAWTLYYLGMALEESGDPGEGLRSLERARSMFSRMRDVYGLACARHHAARLLRDERARQSGNLRNSGFARQQLQDARQDFRAAGVTHGEAWSCVELAVVDAGNGRWSQALDLTDEAERLFAGLGDRRGEDWARFLRCTVLPEISPAGADAAREELAALIADDPDGRDPALTGYTAAWSAALTRGVDRDGEWQAWRLGMTPGRSARDRMSLRDAVA